MPDTVDDYLAGLDDDRRAALQDLRATLRDLLPGADEGLSYGVPVFRIDGRPVAGYSAAARHLSYLPHSGEITTALADELAGFATSKGAVKFTVDEPLPRALVERLVQARLGELRPG